jgi:hypothetical protein
VGQNTNGRETIGGERRINPVFLRRWKVPGNGRGLIFCGFDAGEIASFGRISFAKLRRDCLRFPPAGDRNKQISGNRKEHFMKWTAILAGALSFGGWAMASDLPAIDSYDFRWTVCKTGDAKMVVDKTEEATTIYLDPGDIGSALTIAPKDGEAIGDVLSTTDDHWKEMKSSDKEVSENVDAGKYKITFHNDPKYGFSVWIEDGDLDFSQPSSFDRTSAKAFAPLLIQARKLADMVDQKIVDDAAHVEPPPKAPQPPQSSSAAKTIVSRWRENDHWDIVLWSDGTATGTPEHHEGLWKRERSTVKIHWFEGTDKMQVEDDGKLMVGTNDRGDSVRYVSQ